MKEVTAEEYGKYVVSRKPPWQIDRRKSALLVIDMQNDFVQEGALFEVPWARQQIPRIQSLVETCREVGVPVIYTQHVTDPDKAPRLMELAPILREEGLRVGTSGVEIYRDIAPADADLIIQKNHFSPFYATDIDLHLKEHGVDTLILVGTVTNICIDSTVRDAFVRNYKIVVTSDGCSSLDRDLQKAALTMFAYCFARVMTCSEIETALRQGG